MPDEVTVDGESLTPAELRDRAAEAEEARAAVRDAERRIEDLGHLCQRPTGRRVGDE